MADSAGKDGKGAGGLLGRMFGPTGPMVMSVLWTVLLALMAFMLSFMTSVVDVPGLFGLADFLRGGILYIFLIILFLSYASYFMKKDRRFLVALLPAAAAVAALAALWIASGTLGLIGYELAATAAAYARQYIFIAPAAILAAGYAIVAAMFFLKKPPFTAGMRMTAGAQASPAPTRQGATTPPQQDDDERKLKELKGMMKQAEKKYLNQQIDRETFDKIARDYHERIAEIEGKKAAGA